MLRLHLNENPYQMPQELLAEALQGPLNLNLYPEEASARLSALYARYAGEAAGLPGAVSPAQVVPTRGGDEAIDLTALALRAAVKQVVIAPPTFGEYARAAGLAGLPVTQVPLTADFQLDLPALVAAASQAPSLVYICNPNNPTGNLVAAETALEELTRVGAWVVIDEAYYEFSGRTLLPLTQRYPNLIIIRTLSKAFALAGARLGFAIAAEPLARRLHATRALFNLDAITAAVAAVALSHPEYARELAARIAAGRAELIAGLAAIPALEPYPSCTNFVLVRCPQPAAELRAALAARGVLVRHYPDQPALTYCLRISVGTPDEIAGCLSALRDALAG